MVNLEKFSKNIEGSAALKTIKDWQRHSSIHKDITNSWWYLTSKRLLWTNLSGYEGYELIPNLCGLQEHICFEIFHFKVIINSV